MVTTTRRGGEQLSVVHWYNIWRWVECWGDWRTMDSSINNAMGKYYLTLSIQIFADFVPHQTSFTTPYYAVPRSQDYCQLSINILYMEVSWMLGRLKNDGFVYKQCNGGVLFNPLHPNVCRFCISPITFYIVAPHHTQIPRLLVMLYLTKHLLQRHTTPYPGPKIAVSCPLI